MPNIIETFEKSLKMHIDPETGFSRPPIISLHHDNSLTIGVMLGLSAEQIFDRALETLTDLSVKELVFCLDHYTKPGQGTKYDDVLTVFWWAGERVNDDHGYEFGVIDYQLKPEIIIEPINWHNEFWNGLCRKMIQAEHSRMVRFIAEAKARNPELVARMYNEVLETREKIIKASE